MIINLIITCRQSHGTLLLEYEHDVVTYLHIVLTSFYEFNYNYASQN